MRELPPRARLYVVATAAAAVAVLAVAATQFTGSWLDVVVFATLYALTGRFITATAAGVAVSVSFILGLGAVVIVGPAGVGFVGVAAAFAPLSGDQSRIAKRAFNGAQHCLCAVAAATAFVLLGGTPGALPQSSFPEVILATGLAAITYFVANGALVAGIVSLTSGLSFRRVWSGHFSWMVVSYLGYGLLGLLLAEVWLNVAPFATVFLLAPLLVARSAFNNYAQLREAYDATVRALCQAVETKDYYTRGHSERVARVTEMIAREWGMREDRVQVVRYAGMLHDVGKLGVPTRVLQKQGKLNSTEFEAIKLHPLRGKEMLGEIQFLDEAMAGIMHHHERMDGRGYPLGLMGEEIPEFARIITVADAFDSMTSTRSYREARTVDAAIAEIQRCAGTQFDPRIVACLIRAIDKQGWTPTPEAFFGPQVDVEGRPLNRAEGQDVARG